jgi:Xaa-Pro aminopeptidase
MIKMKKYDDISSELFVKNRSNYSKYLKENSMAIFHSCELMPRVGDGTHTFRQNSDLLYLSGIDQEETTLLIFPNSPIEQYREVLFIRKTSEHIAVWEGRKYTIDEAREQSGIQTIMLSDQFESIFSMLMNYAQNVYINLNENDRAVSDVPYKDVRFAQECKAKYPLHKYERSGPIMSKLRSVKHSLEIEQLQIACDITDKAFRRVLSFVKPGVTEYEIEAEIIHEFIRNRATGHAYNPIIASGVDSCILHYNDNNKVCQDGEVLLMDFGAEYANYCADLTRTIPVNGRFSERQKQVYNACLRVHREAVNIMKPGITLAELNEQVAKVVEGELIGLGLFTKEDVAKQDPKNPLYKKYFMHGNSHFLGLDVHDIGNRYEKLPVGVVITNEPGIYIPAEKIGVRIENDIWISEKGNIDLMRNIPIEVEEIESLMNS